MNELGWHLNPRYLLAKFRLDWKRTSRNKNAYVLRIPMLSPHPQILGYCTRERGNGLSYTNYDRLDLSGTPGLQPIALSPGSWQTSLGLGSMPRCSALMLISFIAYIFLFYSSCWFGWELCRTSTMQCPPTLPIVIKMRLVIRQSNLPACLAEVQLMKTLCGNYATELVKLTDKLDKICISGKFSVQRPSEWRVLLYTCEWFYYFNPEPRLISGILELGQVRLFWQFN